jgi:hypothetical protein
MAKCKNCGKDIAKGLEFCSKECMEAYKEKGKVSVNDFPPIASGSYAREQRIEYVKKLLLNHVSEQQIHDLLAPYFTHTKIEDYIRVAKKRLESEQHGS